MAGVRHQPVAGPNDPTKQVSKTVYEADHITDDGSFVAAKLSATATDIMFGRSSAGAGNGEEIPVTAAGRALAAGASPAAQRATLGLGALATQAQAAIATDVSGLAAGVATFLATPSSANLASAVTDESGSGSLVFGTSPTLTTPVLGSFTFATLPAAASNSGALARVTDVGVAPWIAISDGTRWRPTGGSLLCFATVTRTSVAGAGVETVTNLQKQFPAAFFQTGDRIRVYGSLSKAGTTTGMTAALKIGTNGTTADTSVLGTATQIGNANRTGGLFVDLTIRSATTIQQEGTQAGSPIISYSQATSTAYPGAVGISNVSNSLFVTLTITPGATDAVAMESGLIEVFFA